MENITKNYLKRLTFRCTVFFVLASILTVVILILSFNIPTGPSYGESFRVLSRLRHQLLYKAVFIYSFSFLLTISGVIFISLMYSHRVAGPLYRLSMVMKRIASGDIRGTTILREKDIMHYYAEELNNLVSECRDTLGRAESKLAELRQGYAKFIGEQAAASDDEMRTTISGLAGKAEEIKETMNIFK